MKSFKNKLPLVIAATLLCVGIAYQNCGSQQNKEIITNGFVEKTYTGPKEFSIKDEQKDSTEKTEEPAVEEKVAEGKIAEDTSKKTDVTQDAKIGETLRPTSGRKIDPCKMDTNGNGVIDKNDQKLLSQMMQNGLTPDQIEQFDYNNDGQVNQTEILYYPSHVGEICQKLKKIVVNEQSTCAISRTGKIYCWGSGLYGQLGNGSPFQLLPMEIDVSSLGIANNFKDISAGLYYYCAIHDSGKVYCWGHNEEGVMGNGTTANEYPSPVEINMAGTGFTNDFKSIAAGLDIQWNGTGHACAIHATGQLFCWGNNDDGKLGTGNMTNSATPILVNNSQFSSPEIIDVSAGHHHTCAIDSNEKLYCWGGNAFGALGNGFDTNQLTPAEVGFSQTGFSNTIKDMSAGIDSTCAIDTNNKGFCWGSNEWGQLGIGFMGNNYNLPQPIEDQAPENATFKLLSAPHGRHTCGIGTNGKTYCWVYGSAGQLGNGTTTLMSSHPMDLEVNVINIQ